MRVIQDMLCVVFTDGTFKMRRIYSNINNSCSQDLVSHNLISSLPKPSNLIGNSFRVSKALLSHLTHTDLSSEDTVILALAYQVEEECDLRRIWRHENYQLTITSKNYYNSEVQFERLSYRDLPETTNPSVEVLHLSMKKREKKLLQKLEYETLVYIWNDHSKLGVFHDLSSNAVVNDRQMQEEFLQIYEQFDDLSTLESDSEMRARLS